MNIKKTVYVYFFISLFISVFTCFLCYTSIQKTKKIVVNKEKVQILEQNNGGYIYFIDNAERVNKKIFVEGWLLKKNEDNFKLNRIVVLEDSKKNFYKIFTKSVIRPGITEYFKNEKNYNNTGLQAKGKINRKMAPPFKIYFLIKEKNKELLLDTGKIIN